jgi:hypothetical protein
MSEALHEPAQLDTQIATLRRRREQLQAKHGAPPIVGKTDFSARRAALDEVSAIDAQLVELDAQREAAQHQADRAAQIARLVELASDGRAALTTIEAIYAELDQVLLALLERYSAAVLNQHHARMAFYATLAELAPEVRNLRADHTAPHAILAELEQAGADLRGVLLNFTSPANRPLDLPYAALGLFPGALATALREEAARRAGEHVLLGDVFALPPVAA